ncbi:MAG: helix-turn-helix transcriptional regulator [Gemmatimonadales bacterium]
MLRRTPMTVDEVARALDLTRTAVRSQLASLVHDGLVGERESRRGTSKPSRVYGVTTQAELLFSRAYIPMLTQLLDVLERRIKPKELDSALREAGRSLVAGRSAPAGSLGSRVAAASSLLNDLGGLTEVIQDGGDYTIRSHGCPLAAATAGHPEVCNALESLLTQFIGSRVRQCCERYQRERCCFQVS